MASIDEINAAFDVARKTVDMLIEQEAPYMFKDRIREIANSQRSTILLVEGIRRALKAAEDVRARQELKSGSS